MKALLIFLSRGFALFAGGPAVIYQYSALRRSPMEARKRGGRINKMRYVAFVVLGCAFVTGLWMTVQTHRLYENTASVMVATGTIR